MRQLATLQFGAYTPDQPSLGNPGLELARNVLPRARGYDSLPMLSNYGTTGLPSRALGAFSAKDAGGQSYVFAGTATQLWRLDSLTWTDVSRVTPVYVATNRWEFTTFGLDVIAASRENRPQVLTLGGANFADLTATVVAGAAIATVRSFVVLGDVEDVDGHTPWRVRWGPINNPGGDWAPDPATLADFQDLRTIGGKVQRIIGGEFGMVFRERSTSRMTFTGPPTVWQFDEVDPAIGTIAPGSVVQHGTRIFFFSEDGVRMSTGGASQAVGEEQIDLTLLRDLDTSYLDRVTGAVYTDEQIIVWAYPGAGNVGGTANRLLIYNYGIGKWAIGDEAIEILFQSATPLRSIDGFDDNPAYGGTQTPTLYVSVDDIPGSLDDHLWSGGTFEIGAITNTQDLAFFTGPARDAQFETGEKQLIPGRRAFVTEMRSLANMADALQVEVGHRSNQRDPVIWDPPVVPTAEGFIPTRVDDRYMRFRLTAIGGFEDAVGIDVYGEPSGGR